eukprot:s7265_g5.t1
MVTATGLSEFDGADFVWAQSEAVKTGMNLRGKLNELFKSADSVEGRVQADADGLLLEATWKGMRSLQKALAVVAENLARCKRPGGTLPPVCRFSVEDAFARELQSSVFADCLNIRATQCVQQCEEAMNNFAETAESHHSGQGWKGDLKEDASLQDVLTKAAITIGTLKGNTAQTQLRKFHEKFKDVPDAQLDHKNILAFIERAKKEHAAGIILTIEALFCHALTSNVKAKAKDLIRNQLAEMAGRSLTEDMFQPVLLKEAKALIE